MHEVVINWRRTKPTLYVLYAFLLLVSLVPVLVRKEASLFLSSFVTYSIIFYYLNARIEVAANESLSLPENANISDVFVLMTKFFGGFKKLVMVVVVAALLGVLVVVLGSAL